MRKKLLALSVPSSLTGSFQKQRNSDVFGCSDIGTHFKNRYSSNICFAEGDEATPPPPAPPVSTPPSTQPITFNSQADFDAAVARVMAASKPKDETPPPVSITEQRQQQQQQQQEQQQNQQVLTTAIMFDTQFDGVMKGAAKFFTNPEAVKTIRDDVKESDPVKKASLMGATAAKEFFSNTKNIEILEKSDQEKVKSDILNKRFESDINGVQAWELMNRAIYNHSLKEKHDQMRDNSSAGTGVYGHAKLDAKLKSFYPENVSAL